MFNYFNLIERSKFKFVREICLFINKKMFYISILLRSKGNYNKGE